ncbi:unnamed protein product [Linum trigynum]|uniref:K Homology domain-containing protein n=1 Tax=Linum trigynum TaxID=586398 RepID=A0AAV2D363_9ROSI
MAEEDVAAPPPSSPPLHTDHKRKHDELELPTEAPVAEEEKPMVTYDVVEDKEEIEGGGDDSSAIDGESQEAKRARVEDEPVEEPVGENGFELGKPDEGAKGEAVGEENGKSEVPEESGAQQAPESSQEAGEQSEDKVVNEEAAAAGVDEENDGKKPDSAGDVEPVKAEEQQSKGEDEQPIKEAEEEALSDGQTTSRRMEVPNDKVGVLIGKGGDTIRFLQYNSGAKIQITRDADADPRCVTRPVEIIGTLDSISKAEKLIQAVIAEADAGGSPALVARGHPSVQSAAVAEQLEMQVPNEKVGLIIGKGGDTIKALQAKTGARIQLIPQHLPEGDGSKERTVRVTGDSKQIDMACELIKEVMSQISLWPFQWGQHCFLGVAIDNHYSLSSTEERYQALYLALAGGWCGILVPTVNYKHKWLYSAVRQNVKQSSLSGGFNQQQSYRSRGPSGPNHWGPPRGPHPSQPMPPYDYHNQGTPYPPRHGMHYPPPNYGNYPPQQHMGQRANYGTGWEQRPPPNMPPGGRGGGYDYYGGQGGHMADHHAAPPVSGHPPAPAPATNYGYRHDYGHQPPYPQPPPPHQGYGHGYDEPKYGHANSQPGYPGYPAHHQQYSKQQPQAYPMQAQGQPQPYSQPSQAYGQGAATAQQQYPYQSGYPPYGSATDGYSQAPAQPSAQPVPAYGQAAPAAYGSYQSSQGYPDQAATTQNTAAATGYGYQAQDPAQQVYAQPVPATAPAPAQPSYDQSVAQPGSYAAAPVTASVPGGAAPVGYGKTVSPQPAGYGQYDSSQMYAAPH